MFDLNDFMLYLSAFPAILAFVWGPQSRKLRLLINTGTTVLFVGAWYMVLSLGGVSKGNYNLLGIRFPLWVLPVIVFGVSLLLQQQRKNFRFAMVLGAIVCYLLALVRPLGAYVDLINHTGTFLYRLFAAILYSFSLIVSVVVPAVSLRSNRLADTRKVASAEERKAGQQLKVLGIGAIAYLIVLMVSNRVIEGKLAQFVLVADLPRFIELAFVRVFYFSLINQYLAFRLPHQILPDFGTDRMSQVLELIFCACLYGLLHYLYPLGYIVREVLLGIVLGWMYKSTGRLRYGVLLVSVIDVFAV
jgi:hypothetical protein